MTDKMWGAEPYWGLGYEWDPDFMYTERQPEAEIDSHRALRTRATFQCQALR